MLTYFKRLSKVVASLAAITMGIVIIPDPSQKAFAQIIVNPTDCFTINCPDIPNITFGCTNYQGVSFFVNLNGTWQANDGGTYYVHQVGDQLWWYGRDAVKSPSFTNVFQGKINGCQIVGHWSDVPKSQSTPGSGNLEFQIYSNTYFYRTSETGGFGGSAWSR